MKNARQSFAIILILAAAVALLSHAHAKALSGRVIGVSDGDTVTVLDPNKIQHKIRLAGIDAPEKGQPFGQRSKESLSSLAFGRDVVVQWEKTDRYKRIVGKLLVSGRDVCLEQVKRGMAWNYKKYEREQSVEDATSYSNAESVARKAKIGVWSEPNPVAPWEWRAIAKSK